MTAIESASGSIGERTDGEAKENVEKVRERESELATVIVTTRIGSAHEEAPPPPQKVPLLVTLLFHGFEASSSATTTTTTTTAATMLLTEDRLLGETVREKTAFLMLFIMVRAEIG